MKLSLNFCTFQNKQVVLLKLWDSKWRYVTHNLANQQLSQSGKMNVSNIKRVQVRIVANGSQKKLSVNHEKLIATNSNKKLG